MTVFNPATFSLAPREYPLVVGLGHNDYQDEINARFGSQWKRVPGHPSVRYIFDKTKDVQLTLRLDDQGEPVEFAVYTETLKDFREQFGKITLDCTYHTIDPKFFCMGGQIKTVLEELELW